MTATRDYFEVQDIPAIAATHSLAGGRPLVATRLATSANTGIGTPMGTSRVRHVATKTCADIRLLYGQSLPSEFGGTNGIRVKGGIETQSPITNTSALLSTGSPITSLAVFGLGGAIASGLPITIASGANTQTFTTSAAAIAGATTISVTSQTPNFAYPANSTITAPTVFPITFNGKAFAVIDLNGILISDPVAVELTVGQVFWTRTYISSPVFTNGGTNSYTTMSVLSNIGDSTITSATLLSNPEPGQVITIDQGGSAETAILANPAVSGTGPYVYTFTTTLTKAHANGAVFGQQILSNITMYSDLGEGFTNGSDLSWVPTTIAPTAGVNSGTINALSNIGDTVIQSASGLAGTTFTLDTAGLLENITVRTVQGSVSPFRYYLTTPLAQAHASGVALVSSLGVVLGYSPIAITADRLIGTSKSVTIMASDSIAQGTGNPRALTSFATLALDSGSIPFINSARAGEAAYQYVAPNTSILRRKLITLGTWALIQDATNDIYGGRTLVQVQADVMAACLLAKNRGLKVAVCTVTPRSTSSDFWMTMGNQAITSSGGLNLVRNAYNAWLRAYLTNGLAGAYVDVLFDITTPVECNAAGALTQDGGFWKADASGPYTADGLHPSPLGHALMASAVTTASIT